MVPNRKKENKKTGADKRVCVSGLRSWKKLYEKNNVSMMAQPPTSLPGEVPFLDNLCLKIWLFLGLLEK
tara:strand:- start:602 stop:808 length:207 start_codon:yes stop_codon:yes gene_type:complete